MGNYWTRVGDGSDDGNKIKVSIAIENGKGNGETSEKRKRKIVPSGIAASGEDGGSQSQNKKRKMTSLFVEKNGDREGGEGEDKENNIDNSTFDDGEEAIPSLLPPHLSASIARRPHRRSFRNNCTKKEPFPSQLPDSICHINRLPNELLLCIFDWVEPVHLVASVEAVCRRWRDLTLRWGWSRMRTLDFDSVVGHSGYSQRRIFSLKIETLLSRVGPRLRVLDLSGFFAGSPRPLYGTVLEALKSHTPNVEVLDLSGLVLRPGQLPEIGAVLRGSLRQLRLCKYPSTATHQTPLAIVVGHSNNTSANANNANGDWFETDLAALRAVCPRLESVRVDDAHWGTPNRRRRSW